MNIWKGFKERRRSHSIKKGKNRESFVWNLYSPILEGFKYISILKFLHIIFPSLKDNKACTDGWVLGNLFLSIICLITFPTSCYFWIYGCLRLFEVLIVQINLLLFDEYREKEIYPSHFITSFRRTVLLLIHNYPETIAWFALIYRAFHLSFEVKTLSLNSFIGSLYYSLVPMTTLGYGDITPKNATGAAFVIIQTLIGIFMALLLLARFVALLPKTKSAVEKHISHVSESFNSGHYPVACAEGNIHQKSF